MRSLAVSVGSSCAPAVRPPGHTLFPWLPRGSGILLRVFLGPSPGAFTCLRWTLSPAPARTHEQGQMKI